MTYQTRKKTGTCQVSASLKIQKVKFFQICKTTHFVRISSTLQCQKRLTEYAYDSKTTFPPTATNPACSTENLSKTLEIFKKDFAKSHSAENP